MTEPFFEFLNILFLEDNIIIHHYINEIQVKIFHISFKKTVYINLCILRESIFYCFNGRPFLSLKVPDAIFIISISVPIPQSPPVRR